MVLPQGWICKNQVALLNKGKEKGAFASDGLLPSVCSYSDYLCHFCACVYDMEHMYVCEACVCVLICTYMCRGHRTTLGVVLQVPSKISRQNLLLVWKLSSRLGYWASRLQGSCLSILLVKELQAHIVFLGFLKWVLWHPCSGSQACRANIVPTDPSSPLALLGILLPGGPASPC